MKAASSALLTDAKKSLNQLQEISLTPCAAKVNEFIPINKDPGSRRTILFPTGVGHEKSDDAWTVKGIRQWHKMKGRGKCKQGKLSGHFSSNSHKASLDALVAFQRKFQHINNIMDNENVNLCTEAEAEKQINGEAIKILIDIACVLARQVLLVARHSPALRHWLGEAEKRLQRATYLNWHSQNEFLQLLSDDMSEKFKAEIETAQFIAVMADTTSDASHLDQLSVVLRYVTPSGAIHERLVDMNDVNKKTGKFKGCQAKMSQYLERTISYFPCLSHRINTTVEHRCEASVVIAAMFDVLDMIYVFFTSSTKHYMELQKAAKDKEIEEALNATINILKYLRNNEDNRNLQIEAAIVFSAKHGINAQSEFAKHYRKRVVPRRIDDNANNAIHLDLKEHYRKEFLQVIDAQFDADLFQSIQEFVCILYGLRKTADVNEARHLKFCRNKGKIPEPQQFPPTSDELYLHCQRVSYCTAIAKAALESNPAIPSPNGYGWKINNENALEVTWMTQKPASESIQKVQKVKMQGWKLCLPFSWFEMHRSLRMWKLRERGNWKRFHGARSEEENEEEDQESLGTDSEDENASDVENE
eukprot:gene19699-21648_t